MRPEKSQEVPRAASAAASVKDPKPKSNISTGGEKAIVVSRNIRPAIPVKIARYVPVRLQNKRRREFICHYFQQSSLSTRKRRAAQRFELLEIRQAARL